MCFPWYLFLVLVCFVVCNCSSGLLSLLLKKNSTWFSHTWCSNSKAQLLTSKVQMTKWVCVCVMLIGNLCPWNHVLDHRKLFTYCSIDRNVNPSWLCSLCFCKDMRQLCWTWSISCALCSFYCVFNRRFNCGSGENSYTRSQCVYVYIMIFVNETKIYSQTIFSAYKSKGTRVKLVNLCYRNK